MDYFHYGIVVRPNYALYFLEIGTEKLLAPIDLVESAIRKMGVQFGFQSWSVVGKHQGMHIEAERD